MTKDMTKGSPFKLILGFAFPMLLGMLFQQFYNLVDTMIVGKTLGVSAPGRSWSYRLNKLYDNWILYGYMQWIRNSCCTAVWGRKV